MNQEEHTRQLNRQVNFKRSMPGSNLCDYSDAYLLVRGNITVNNTTAEGAAANKTNKKLIFKTCAPFSDCIIKKNNTQVDNAKDIDLVMLMHNVMEYSNNYSKTCGSWWQDDKYIPAVNNNGDIVDFNVANATDSFNFKTKITDQTNNNGRINVGIIVTLKYSRIFWRTFKMLLINCEVNLILTWPVDCVIIYTNVANQVPTFTTTIKILMFR